VHGEVPRQLFVTPAHLQEDAELVRGRVDVGAEETKRSEAALGDPTGAKEEG